jgi:hypothetical protein
MSNGGGGNGGGPTVDANAWHKTGDIVGTPKVLGPDDDFPIDFQTKSIRRLRINQQGTPLPPRHPPPGVFPGGILIGGIDVDPLFPNGDIVYIEVDLPDQLLVTLRNPSNDPANPAGAGYLLVMDDLRTGGIQSFNSSWPPGLDGVNPGETTLIGFGSPVAIVTQPGPPGDLHPVIRLAPEETDLILLQKGKIGLNGAVPVAQPTITGSRGGNAALASLLTALALRGDIVDGTTP